MIKALSSKKERALFCGNYAGFAFCF